MACSQTGMVRMANVESPRISKTMVFHENNTEYSGMLHKCTWYSVPQLDHPPTTLKTGYSVGTLWGKQPSPITQNCLHFLHFLKLFGDTLEGCCPYTYNPGCANATALYLCDDLGNTNGNCYR